MKRSIYILLFTLIVSALSAQTEVKTFELGNVISDTLTFRNYQFRSDLAPILKSTNKIEIRLKTEPSFEYSNYIILSYTNRWSVTYYYYKPDSNILFSRILTPKVDLDSIFGRLVSNNVFSLPDQSDLKTNKFVYIPETDEMGGPEINVLDGTCYILEFKVSENYRRYIYYNPEIYADFYPLVYELRNFTNIVGIFNELTKE